MRSLLIKDTTREERRQIVHQALWGIDGLKEIREINAEYSAPFVRG